MNKKFIEFMILSKKTELKMWELKLNQLTTQETKPLAKPFSNPLSKETVEDTFNDKSFYTRKEIRERLPIEVSTSTIIRDLELTSRSTSENDWRIASIGSRVRSS